MDSVPINAPVVEVNGSIFDGTEGLHANITEVRLYDRALKPQLWILDSTMDTHVKAGGPSVVRFAVCLYLILNTTPLAVSCVKVKVMTHARHIVRFLWDLIGTILYTCSP